MTPKAAAIANAFGVTPNQGEILCALFESDAGYVGWGELVRRGRVSANLNTLKVQVCKLNAALGPGYIERQTVKPFGYRLTEKGRDVCRRAFRRAYAEFAATDGTLTPLRIDARHYHVPPEVWSEFQRITHLVEHFAKEAGRYAAELRALKRAA